MLSPRISRQEYIHSTVNKEKRWKTSQEVKLISNVTMPPIPMPQRLLEKETGFQWLDLRKTSYAMARWNSTYKELIRNSDQDATWLQDLRCPQAGCHDPRNPVQQAYGTWGYTVQRTGFGMGGIQIQIPALPFSRRPLTSLHQFLPMQNRGTNRAWMNS